jgi:hypothetical protein
MDGLSLIPLLRDSRFKGGLWKSSRFGAAHKIKPPTLTDIPDSFVGLFAPVRKVAILGSRETQSRSTSELIFFFVSDDRTVHYWVFVLKKTFRSQSQLIALFDQGNIIDENLALSRLPLQSRKDWQTG